MSEAPTTDAEAELALKLKRWRQVKAMQRCGHYLRNVDASPKKPSELLDVVDVRSEANILIEALLAMLPKPAEP